jgi:hypothetical protein
VSPPGEPEPARGSAAGHHLQALAVMDRETVGRGMLLAGYAYGLHVRPRLQLQHRRQLRLLRRGVPGRFLDPGGRPGL